MSAVGKSLVRLLHGVDEPEVVVKNGDALQSIVVLQGVVIEEQFALLGSSWLQVGKEVKLNTCTHEHL